MMTIERRAVGLAALVVVAAAIGTGLYLRRSSSLPAGGAALPPVHEAEEQTEATHAGSPVAHREPDPAPAHPTIPTDDPPSTGSTGEPRSTETRGTERPATREVTDHVPSVRVPSAPAAPGPTSLPVAAVVATSADVGDTRTAPAAPPAPVPDESVASRRGSSRPVASPPDPRETAAPSSLVVSMMPSAQEIAPGERLDVTIRVDSALDLAHAPFHVTFDPQVLRFEGGEEGAFLASDGAETAFFATPTTEGDAVVVGLSRLGQLAGLSGGGDLCVLHFVAVGSGDAALEFARAKVKDPGNRIVPARFSTAAVNVR